MRRPRLALGPIAVIAALALGAAAGCGGDDDGDEVTVPEITIPAETETAPETTPTPTTEDPSGGTGTPDPAQPDSPENDVPPPPGSPQEAFEKFCEQNPGACG